MILIPNNLQICKAVFFNGKEAIAWAINTYKSQSVLFCQPIVLVAFYGISHYLWREWLFLMKTLSVQLIVLIFQWKILNRI